MPPSAHDPSAELARFQDNLKQMAQEEVDRRLWDRIDLSGVVQQTLLDAWQAGERFHGLNEQAKPAWLRTVLVNNLTDRIRKLRAQIRDMERERSLDEAMDASSARLAAWMAADQSSPSQKAIRNEESERLYAALAQLSEDRRKAVELHLKGRTLAEMAREMGKTEDAVAQLVHRGIKDLHSLLDHQ
jgi:RNA polymerase sigma-70 factor (ECF subfamily)